MKIQANHLLLVGFSALALWGAASPSYAVSFGSNLVVNGGAETFTGGPNTVADFAGWTRTGNVFQDYYADFPVNFIGGTPANIGDSYFFGGNQAQSNLTQLLDLSSIATQIDEGNVSFDLGGLLGTRTQTPLSVSLLQ